MEEMKDGSARDAALIAAAHKVEHYEIASSGTVIAWAAPMGHKKEQALLAKTLAEEKAADEKLTDSADSVANYAAEQIAGSNKNEAYAGLPKGLRHVFTTGSKPRWNCGRVACFPG